MLPFFIVVIERDRRMQQRWLNKGLCHAFAPSNVAGTWDGSNGDLADFLKKVQESGASIESATVYHGIPPCELRNVNCSVRSGYGVPLAAREPAEASKRGVAHHSVSASGGNNQIMTEDQEKKEKERFLMFTRVLMK